MATTFSEGEMKLFTSIIANMSGDIATNWAAVAKELSYKDASIAKTRWGQIKRKNGIGGGVKKAGDAPGKRGRSKNDVSNENSGDGNADEVKEEKKGKGKGKGRNKKVKTEMQEKPEVKADSDENEVDAVDGADGEI